MGCCSSVDPKTRDREFRKFRRTIRALELSDSDVKNIYEMFIKMDEDMSGEIDLMEFFMFLDLERTKFAVRAFSLFDEDKSGEIDFGEFLASIWNYCTYDKRSLIRFAFKLYDLDGSGMIDQEEMSTIVREVYGKNANNSQYAKNILEKIESLGGKRSKGDIEVSSDLFEQFAIKHPAMLFPAFQLQRDMQSKVLGVRFWERLTRKRLKDGFEDVQIMLDNVSKAGFDDIAGASAEDRSGHGPTPVPGKRQVSPTGGGGGGGRGSSYRTSSRRATESIAMTRQASRSRVVTETRGVRSDAGGATRGGSSRSGSSREKLMRSDKSGRRGNEAPPAGRMARGGSQRAIRR